jgi:hypothetical protein
MVRDVTVAAAPRFELVQRARAAMRTVVGRLIVVLIATGMLAGLKTPFWWAIGFLLTLTSVLPQRRKEILIFAAAAWTFFDPPVDQKLLTVLAAKHGALEWARAWPIAMVAVWLLAWAYLWCIRQFPKSPVGRRPVIGLIVVMFALFAAAQAPAPGPARVLIAAAAMAFGQYLWFFAYWVSENHSREKGRALLRVYNWRPFWGYTGVPFGKGAAYLERVEAKDDEQLALSQLKGLKLLALAVFWTAVLIVLNRALYGPTESLTKVPTYAPYAHLPTYTMALDEMIKGHPYPLPMRWLALVGYFVTWVVSFTVFGHTIIAICRLAGFNAFRNTFRPFLATSVADFYNRIYYYFKELLVTFFFYPTYLRYFKKHPKLRLFAATLAAAGFGNFLYHFLRAQDRIIQYGLLDTLWFFRAFAIYTLLLGIAISISQLRVLAHKGKAPVGARRVMAISGVLLFYTLICILEEPNDRHTLSHYGNYFVSLFVP